MPALKGIAPAILAFLFLLAGSACSPAAPSATSSARPTAPTETPAFEEPQMPPLPVPAMQGILAVGAGPVLSFQCFGEGTPTVIVEAGAGDKPTLSSSWNAVILGVSPATRICIYDRVPVTTTQIGAENLHLLLTKVPIPGPYILVAHSLGGWFARVFAHLYPQDVAGMLLVDTTATAPEAAIIYATAYPTPSAGELASLTQYRMSETDIYTGELMPSMDGLDMKASNAQVQQAGSFGDLPLVVICHTPSLLDLSAYDPAVKKQMAAIQLKIMADQAALSSKGVFMVARTGQHFISEYQPQFIIDAINQMVAGLRKK
jgi:pimeloyl-ACP methyl ester carboxylesterase